MKKVKQNKTYYFQCNCSSQEHTFGVEFDIEEKEVAIHLQLTQPRNFLRRLVIAVKYLFGYECRYGHWDVTLMNEEKFMDFYNIMTRYVYTAGFTNKAAIKIKQALQEVKDGKRNTAIPNGLHSKEDVTEKYRKM